jgi:hypothetical protein
MVVEWFERMRTSIRVTDLYNRQLHPDEEKKLKELQKDKTAEEQYRLAAAECAMVHCADHVPDSDPNSAVLQKMQTDGQGYTFEQNLLKQAGAFDGYDNRLDAINDWYGRYQVGNRAVGAVQGVMGSVAAGVVLGAGCASVAACVAGAAVAGTSLDYSKAGFTQLLNGDVALTYGEQALQSLGLSPQAAAIAYAGLGMGAAAGSVVANNTASKVTTTTNSTAVSQADLDTLAAKGVKFTPQNVVATGTTPGGQVIFLETGNSSAGLQHIIDGHVSDFANIGVSQAQIPGVVIRAVTEGNIVGY